MKRDKYDKAVSDLVRESNDYVCEKCGYQVPRGEGAACHASHFKSRSILVLRYCLTNIACLCASCHRHLGQHPDEHSAWFNQRLGGGLVDIINEKLIEHTRSRRKITKFDKEDSHKHYLSEIKRIKALRMDGVTGYIEAVDFW